MYFFKKDAFYLGVKCHEVCVLFENTSVRKNRLYEKWQILIIKSKWYVHDVSYTVVFIFLYVWKMSTWKMKKQKRDTVSTQKRNRGKRKSNVCAFTQSS